MKKYISVAALLVAGTAFASATVESGEYTLNVDQQWTTGDETLYNFLNGAINEGGTLTFDLSINYTGTNCGAYQTLLHIGQKDTGMSIMANGGPKLIVGEQHITDDAYNNHELGEAADFVTGSNAVSVIIKGNATPGTARVDITVNGTKHEGLVADLVWDAMAWNTENGENAKYSVNVGAPGWSDLLPAQSTTLTAAKATFIAIPEPSAFGLLAGLGALALVGMRRRRK